MITFSWLQLLFKQQREMTSDVTTGGSYLMLWQRNQMSKRVCEMHTTYALALH